jgi:DNA-binding transcriptional regulator PaaX
METQAASEEVCSAWSESVLELIQRRVASPEQVEDIAQDLGMTDGAIRVALHRMKTRLGELIRQETADTLPPDVSVDDEISELKRIAEQAQ